MDGPPGLTGPQGPAGGKGPEGLQGQKVSNFLYTTVYVQRDIYIIMEVISSFQWISFSWGDSITVKNTHITVTIWAHLMFDIITCGSTNK